MRRAACESGRMAQTACVLLSASDKGVQRICGQSTRCIVDTIGQCSMQSFRARAGCSGNACRPVILGSHSGPRKHLQGMSAIMPDARFASLTPLFAPRSVAVLGASSDPTRISGRPIAYMKAQGFQGGLYPVNPNRAEIQGLKAFPSVADLPETPDVAIVAVPASLAEPA